MAGDWIKMRGGLFASPKLIGMSRALHDCQQFRDWLTPGGGGALNGQLVSDHALRCVTGALLCVTWSWSREFGKALPNGDCLLPHVSIADIDGIAGAPGVGLAMASVGWAKEASDGIGVVLPKFFVEHNVAMTPAEKQKAYRDRKRKANGVTEALPISGNKTVTREEKRRVDNPPPPPTSSVEIGGGGGVSLGKEEETARENLVRHVVIQGLARGRQAVESALDRGVTVEALWDVVAYWESTHGALQAGALHERLTHAEPGQRPDAGWPDHERPGGKPKRKAPPDSEGMAIVREMRRAKRSDVEIAAALADRGIKLDGYECSNGEGA